MHWYSAKMSFSFKRALSSGIFLSASHWVQKKLPLKQVYDRDTHMLERLPVLCEKQKIGVQHSKQERWFIRTPEKPKIQNIALYVNWNDSQWDASVHVVRWEVIAVNYLKQLVPRGSPTLLGKRNDCYRSCGRQWGGMGNPAFLSRKSKVSLRVFFRTNSRS